MNILRRIRETLHAYAAERFGVETRYRVHSNATEILKRIKSTR